MDIHGKRGLDLGKLPAQILLNNLLYDPSELGIPFDGVRSEAVARPQVWDMGGLMRFAGVMGPLSSLFDFLTFGVLLFVFHASPAEFRTAWFLESMATQILVIFVIRTNGRPWRDSTARRRRRLSSRSSSLWRCPSRRWDPGSAWRCPRPVSFSELV